MLVGGIGFSVLSLVHDINITLWLLLLLLFKYGAWKCFHRLVVFTQQISSTVVLIDPMSKGLEFWLPAALSLYRFILVF